MKMALLGLVAVVIAGNAWADCRALEYAEIKDMSTKELKKELSEIDVENRRLLDLANNQTSEWKMEQAQATMDKSIACSQIRTKLQKALDRRVKR